MAFINDKKLLGRNKAKKTIKRRAKMKSADGKVFADFGYDVMPIKNDYSFDVLPTNEYGELPIKNEYGYTPSLPAPPENCQYVFDAMGNATLKCSDLPLDAYVTPPIKTDPLPSSYASFNFPNWSTLTCEEIQKYISSIEQELTYIRVTPDIMAIYDKQLEYARLLLSEKCKKAVDIELGLCPEPPLASPPLGYKYIKVKEN